MTHLDRIAASLIIVLLTVWAVREADYAGCKKANAAPIVVSVTGAVARPGVIQLPAASRAVHAITICGGLTAEADSEGLELARTLTDGEHLRVPAVVRESPPPPASALLATLSRGSSPDPGAASSTNLPLSSGQTPSQPKATEPSDLPSSSTPRKRSAKTLPSAPIDINTASVEDLIALPGIGPRTAQRIVESRQIEHSGTFTSLEDLATIRGIKGKTLSRLRPYLKIEGS